MDFSRITQSLKKVFYFWDFNMKSLTEINQMTFV